jgi:hypothetical protein
MTKLARLFADGGPLDDMGLGAYPVGVTGTERGWTDAQELTFAYGLNCLLAQEPTDFIHGGCVGVDAQAHKVVRANFPECRIHVLWGHIPEMRARIAPDPFTVFYEPRECSHRNARIAARVVALFSIPKEMQEILRSGTWQTTRFYGIMNRNLPVARPLYVITPDGLIDTEWKSVLVGQTLNPAARKEWAVQ